MGSKEEEAEPIISTPKRPLLSIQLPVGHESPEHSGMLTPPLHTSASVPFRWEEEPGKPRPCTALITTTTTQTLSHQDPHSADTPNYYNNKCLELPPRLQSFIDPKMSSPTTVLDGPYSFPLFQSSSFRFTTTRRRERQGSFGSSCGGSPERGQFGNSINVLLSNKSSSSSSSSVDHEGNKGRSSGGFFGSWRRKSSHKRGKSEVGGGGSFVFSSSVDLAGFGTFDDLESGGGGPAGGAKVKKASRIARNGSFSSLSQVRSHFWATIYKGFKQVLPWKSTNARKDGLLV
ncbi:hypothetical protein RHGRI_018965 [Rhododendron griersonianum]|uniref:Uncharacterized protein n=1 Tax=Rhododendron griersonianum TaxID=479676 RepID=A0AAV6JG69_9ERIC|nr:hypothetical protein RHGRI_018965 [Rhododendron griersonianum]